MDAVEGVEDVDDAEDVEGVEEAEDPEEVEDPEDPDPEEAGPEPPDEPPPHPATTTASIPHVRMRRAPYRPTTDMFGQVRVMTPNRQPAPPNLLWPETTS